MSGSVEGYGASVSVRASIDTAEADILRSFSCCAGPQQLTVNMQPSALQLPSSGFAGAGRRLLGLPSHLVTLSITPQPGQV